jgi:hypothetical protein
LAFKPLEWPATGDYPPMDADKIAYMRVQSDADSQSVKAVKWQFCGLVTLTCNHSGIAGGIQGALETLFSYCQYLIETGQ